MAEALHVLKRIEKIFLACSICFEQLDDPIGLPCLHAYCFECLQNWYIASGSKGQVLCPACKKPAQVPEDGIRGFPGHFLVKNLKETVDREKMKAESSSINVGSSVRIKINKDKATDENVGIVLSITNDEITVQLLNSLWTGLKSNVELWTEHDQEAACELCDQPAKNHCLDCKQYLCTQCLKSHNAFKAMRKHEVVPASDVLSGKISNKGRYCEVHNEPVKYYCMSEDKQVCQDCVSLKICPIEHDRVALDKAARQHISSLQQLLVECNKKRDTFSMSMEKTDQVKEDLKKSYDKAQEALENVASMANNKLEELLEDKRSILAKIHAEKEEVLKNTESDLTIQYTNAVETCDKVSDVIASGSDYDLTYQYKEMKASLEGIVSAPDPEIAADSLSDIKFDPGKPENYINSKGSAASETATAAATVPKKSLGDKWCLVDQFITPVNFRGLRDVAYCQDHNLAIASRNGTKIFSPLGEIVSTLRNAPRVVNSVAVTPDDRIIVDGNTKLLCYNKDGKQLRTIDTYYSPPVSVAVDSKGRIIAGLNGNEMGIYYADGTNLLLFEFQDRPHYISPVITMNKLVITFSDIAAVNKKLYLGNYDEQRIPWTVIQPPPSVYVWDPGYTCCSPQGEIYVINEGHPNQIYAYDCDGEYEGPTGIYGARGIAFNEDGYRLVVVEEDGLVKTYVRLS